MVTLPDSGLVIGDVRPTHESPINCLQIESDYSGGFMLGLIQQPQHVEFGATIAWGYVYDVLSTQGFDPVPVIANVGFTVGVTVT